MKICLKKVERLVLPEVLERENDSEWVCPSFAQPKPKTNWVSFISDFINLNKKLGRKPYPMTNINEMLFKLEGFQYATSLDQNMRYYNIWLRKKGGTYVILFPLEENIVTNV